MPILPPVIVLMYHKVGLPVTSKEDTFLNVSTLDFRRQMRLLKSLGYEARTFGEVAQAWRDGKTLPARTCVITFDDAYCSVWENAYPILKECGMVGTLFVISQCIGKTNLWEHLHEKRVLPIMGVDSLLALHKEGWEIAGHTRTHPHLDKLDDAAALDDIYLGKVEVEELLGIPLKTFCYPYGHLNSHTPLLVQQAGYLAACTAQSGVASSEQDPFLIPRIKIAYRDRYWGFLYRLILNHRLPELRRHRRSRIKSVPNPH